MGLEWMIHNHGDTGAVPLKIKAVKSGPGNGEMTG